MSEIADNVTRACAGDAAECAALERRLFRGMCVAVALAVAVSAALGPWRVTTGLLLGGLLSLFNHHWLRAAISAAFGGARSERPRLSAARYVLRYFVIAGVVVSAVSLDLVSVGATLAGLCSFVAALFAEAATQFYYAISRREDA